MTTFIRLLDDKDKGSSLSSAISVGGDCVFRVNSSSFSLIPGSPFAYWVSDDVREIFVRLPPFNSESRSVKQGLATADDFRFVRTWWEVGLNEVKWFPYAKGGAFSPFYSDVAMKVNWAEEGAEIRNNLNERGGIRSNIWMLKDTTEVFFLRPGLTWPLRGITFSAQAVPDGCIFSVAGKMAFAPLSQLGSWLAIFNSRPFDYLVRLFAGKVGGVQYEVGLIAGIPVVSEGATAFGQLAALARRAWSLKRALDTTTETSHAFLLPLALRGRIGGFHPAAIEAELAHIQAEIDEIAFDLYGFSAADRLAALESVGGGQASDEEPDEEEEASEPEAPPVDGLLSWAVGVAFGRFDWRLATGERAAPAEPEPFDPLPARSPGMLQEGAEPFHAQAGILVDDPGHPHDLARLVEEVLVRVDVAVPDEVRRWLGREFFEFHLKRYSKSRRKAPIYWPLSTASGSYTLWLYYPSLSDQMLYSAVNDFVEPKLGQVAAEARALREKGTGRSRAEEKRFEELQAFELELIELRDALLRLAPTYKPKHDDGVQISAAPLWSLFRHRAWQKVLKETWAKLEKGDYDWAHLAMNYWPERVRETCRSDKSLAMAHGLEDLYEEPEPASSRRSGQSGGPSK